MNDQDKINLDRHIEKIELAMRSASIFFERDSEAKAALHITDRVIYSPIYTLLNEAMYSLDEVKEALKNNE